MMNDEESDSLLLSPNKIFSSQKGVTTMNTRAPTNLHERTAEKETLISNAVSYDDQDMVPHDEGGSLLKEPDWMSGNISRNGTNGMIIPPERMFGVGKKQQHQEQQQPLVSKRNHAPTRRPWSKNDADLSEDEEDVQIIGVPTTLNSNNKNALKQDDLSLDNDDDISDGEDGEHTNSRAILSHIHSSKHNTTVPTMDLLDINPRWAGHDSQKEADEAHVKAIGLAAEKAAREYDEQQDLIQQRHYAHDDDDDDDEPTGYFGKSRLSSKKTYERNNFQKLKSVKSQEDNLTHHERVKREAIMMLQLADKVTGTSSSSDIKNLKRTPTGGYTTSSFTKNPTKRDVRFQIDEDEVMNSPVKEVEIFEDDVMEDHPPVKNTNTSSWSSRYSIDRHLRALNGGLSSHQVLNQMDQENYNDFNSSKKKSATNMFKSSPHQLNSTPSGASVGYGSGSGRNSQSVQSAFASLRTINTWMAHLSSKFSFSNDKDGFTTLGSHRSQNHSNPNANSGFFSRMFGSSSSSSSPSSFRGGVNLMNAHDLPSHMHFSSHDDYMHERRQKRSKILMYVMATLLVVAVLIGTLGTTGIFKGIGSNNSIMGGSYGGVGEELSFFATSDSPYNQAEADRMIRQLQQIDASSNEFLVHLGDVSLADVSLCTNNVYADAAAALSFSMVPVFVLPGDNDWNNCPYPMDAFDNWSEYLGHYEDQFEYDNGNFFSVERQLVRDENFSFLHKGVLFIGVNLVNGVVQDEREWSTRIAHNVQWVEERLKIYDSSEYRALVLMGHSPPSAMVGDFFWSILDDFEAMDKPILYLHAHDEIGYRAYKPFSSLPHFTALEMNLGGISTPVQITVGFGPEPFQFNSKVISD